MSDAYKTAGAPCASGRGAGLPVRGKIIRGIAGFYYVHAAGAGIYECKAKGIFRNLKVKPLVGDDVEITVLDEGENREISSAFCRGGVRLSGLPWQMRIRR